eukprot:3477365-Ditylum_brightwellii.AAC.1
MEADAALVPTTKMYEEHGLVIKTILADDNILIEAAKHHSYAEKGKLPDLFPGYDWPHISE